MRSSRKWLVIAFFLTLIISLPLFILASKKQQDVRSHAAEPAQTEIPDDNNGNSFDEAVDSGSIDPNAQTPTNSTGASSPLSPNTNLNKEVYGFIPYWEVNDTANTYLQYKYLTTLSYFGIPMTKDGDIRKDGSPYKIWAGTKFHQIAVNAHNSGVRIHPSIVLFKGSNIHEMLTKNQDKAINNIMDVLKNSPNPVDGVNIDFETPDTADRDEFISFIKKLDTQMKAENPKWTLIIDTLGSAADSKNSPLPELSKYSDAFFVMSYHFKDPGKANTAGSKNKYDVLQRVVDRYLSKVDPNKVILGFPLYTSAWKTADNSLNSPTTGGAGQKLYRQIAADVKNIDVNYDPAEKTAWYSLKCGNDWEQVYYDNRKALDDKFALINNNNLGGVGFWAFNQDSGSMDTWNAIYDSFGASGVQAPSPKQGFSVVPAKTDCKAVQGPGGGGGGGGGGEITSKPTVPPTKTPTAKPTINLSQYKSADINGDGKIDLLDWNLIRACSIFTKWRDSNICSQGSDKQKSSDLDKTNEVDQDDVTLWILKYHASKK